MFEIGKKGTPESGSRPESSPVRTETSAPRTSSGMGGREQAVIGPSIHIDGDVRQVRVPLAVLRHRRLECRRFRVGLSERPEQ